MPPSLLANRAANAVFSSGLVFTAGGFEARAGDGDGFWNCCTLVGGGEIVGDIAGTGGAGEGVEPKANGFLLPKPVG